MQKFKQTEIGLIPEDWEVKRLGDCLLRNPDYGINAPAVEYDDTLPKYLRITDISDNGKFIKATQASVNSVLSNSYYLENGDIVFARTGASVGKTYLYNEIDGPLVFAGFLIRIKTNPEIIDYQYLIYLTQTKNYWVWVARNSKRSGQPGLNSNDYKAFPIPLPPTKAEQTAIATALSDADAWIGSLEKLIAKKRLIKQGAMQELLKPKEGWVLKRLGECLLNDPEYGINAGAVPYSDALPTYIRITDISDDGNFIHQEKVSVNHLRSNQYYLKTGDLVFARTGASVGKTYLYNESDGLLVFAGFLIRIRPNPEILNPYFLKSITETKPYWDWVNLMSMRSGQPGINGNEFKQLPLYIPTNKLEQTKISISLWEMDSEISNLKTKLAKAQSLKQGMMQQLLSGKIRLV